MPDLVIWDLRFPTSNSEEFTRFRHFQSVLRSDEHVQEVHVYSPPNSAQSEMTVCFRDGYSRPHTHEVQGLNVLYPARWAMGQPQLIRKFVSHIDYKHYGPSSVPSVRTWHERLMKEDEDF
jgi:hypothetical protein